MGTLKRNDSATFVSGMNSLLNFVYRYKLNYLAFLVIAWLLLNLIYLTTYITPFRNLMLLAAMGPGVYISVYILMPYFLYEKKYIIYTLLISLLICVCGYFSGLLHLRFYLEEYPNDKNNVDGLYFFRTGAYGITFLIAFFTSAKLFIDRLRAENVREQIQREKLEAELQFLKAQLNPHFIFNAYNNIYFLIDKNPKLASEILLKLSDIMRYQLYEGRRDRVNILKEVENISNFVEIEKIRKGDKLKVHTQWNELAPDAHIVPFMLLTFVENAFKHVSGFNDRPNEVSIDIEVKDQHIYFNIKNTYEKTMRRPDQSGIGLTNVKRQLELIYKNKYKLEVDDDSEWFQVKLDIQY
jgi:sensor histidine kinase YesM